MEKAAAGPLRGTGPDGDSRFFPVPQGQPGADAATLAQRRRHNEMIMAALREAAETDDNVAHRAAPWRK